MSYVSIIIKAAVAALPGLVALFKAFGNKDEPSTQDITDKAKTEIEELEAWKKAVQ